MDADTLLGLSIGLLACAIVAWIAQRIAGSAPSARCPACGARIPSNPESSERGRCPQCEAAAEQPRASSSDDVVNDCLLVCNACGQPLTKSVTVPLWDGKNYCEICVAEQDATLPDYARQHNVLSAVTPFSFRRSIMGGLCTATILAVGALCIFSLFVGVVWLEGQLPPLRRPPRYLAFQCAKWFGISWCVLAVLCVVASFFASWFAFPRTIAIQAGRVLISPPGNQLARLDEVLWADADSRYDTVDNACWPRRKGVVLFTKRTKRRSNGFLVGETEEDRQRWAAFLTLADVRRQPIAPWRFAEPKRSEIEPKQSATEAMATT